MSRRFRLGARSNGDVGLFISKPGFDAYSTSDSNLVMNVSNKKSQLILLGSIAASGGLVPLGLGSKPFIFLTSQWNFSGVTGHTLGSGPMRPSPMLGGTSNRSTATVNSGGASMTIACATKTTYAVYSQVFS